jgi:hypothetical protein
VCDGTGNPTLVVRAVLSTESDTMGVWLEPDRVRGWW